METGYDIFRALGMTLIHSLWQGALIAALIMFSLILVGKTNSRARYRIQFSGLMLLLTSFVVTFALVYRKNHLLSVLKDVLPAVRAGDNIAQVIPVSPSSLSDWITGLLDPFYPYLALFWMTGFVITGIRMTGGIVLSGLSNRKDLQLPDTGLQRLFEGIKTSMLLSPDLKLRISKRLISPMVTGIFSPMVIIPAAAVSGLSVEQLHTIMIHELAHIKRLDPIFIIVQAIARMVLFFHPLAWYLGSEIDRERENCCDDFVIRRNNDPINYIKALAMIQEMNFKGTPVNALTGKSNQLLGRIRRLIKPETRHTATFRLSVILSLLTVAGLSTMAFIITDSPDVKPASKEIQQAGPVNSVPKENTVNTNIPYDRDGDKKKMTIVFANDTIKEITVNGRKISKEEMKNYAEEIRKVQQELESSQQELERAHAELEDAHRQLEYAHRELEEAKRNGNFHFDSPDLNNLRIQLEQELSAKNFNPDQFRYQMENELSAKNFNLDQFRDQMQNEEFNKQFMEQMNQAREDAMKAFEEARLKHGEYLDSKEFKEQMRKAGEEAKKAREEAEKAFEEFRKSGKFIEDFQYHFNFENPQGPQDPPAKAPHVKGTPPAVPQSPEPPDVPDVKDSPDAIINPENEIEEVPEIPEIEAVPEAGDHETLEIEDKQEANPKADELDNKLRELEEE